MLEVSVDLIVAAAEFHWSSRGDVGMTPRFNALLQ
jgi:hypothetical protein